MNKYLSLTALLFLAGPTLLTYGAKVDSENHLQNLLSEQFCNPSDLDPILVKKLRELAPNTAHFLLQTAHLDTFVVNDVIWRKACDAASEVDAAQRKVLASKNTALFEETSKANTAQKTLKALHTIHFKLARLATEAALEEILRRNLSPHIPDHYLLKRADVTALSSTALSSMLCDVVPHPPPKSKRMYGHWQKSRVGTGR